MSTLKIQADYGRLSRRLGDDATIAARLPAEHKAAWDRLCKQHGTDSSKMLRFLIENALSAEGLLGDSKADSNPD